jgi:hypothetical protein
MRVIGDLNERPGRLALGVLANEDGMGISGSGGSIVVAKNQGSGRSMSGKASSGKGGSYRSVVSGRLVGRTKDGISIIGPKSGSRHFTKKQARDAVDSTRRS